MGRLSQKLVATRTPTSPICIYMYVYIYMYIYILLAIAAPSEIFLTQARITQQHHAGSLRGAASWRGLRPRTGTKTTSVSSLRRDPIHCADRAAHAIRRH